MDTSSILRSLYRALPRPPTSHHHFKHFSINPYKLLPPDAVIFDIGSKNSRGSTYALGSPPLGSRVVNVDIAPGPGVDVVADAHDLHMILDNSVDCVVSVSTLEHVRHPQKVIDEIYRILKPGGFIYLNAPFIFPFHADPDDFYRFSSNGITVLCEKFILLESGFNRGPASTMSELLVHFFAMLFCFNNKTLYGINIDLWRWLLFWFKYLDYIFRRYGVANVIYTGSYFIGKKPPGADKI